MRNTRYDKRLRLNFDSGLRIFEDSLEIPEHFGHRFEADQPFTISFFFRHEMVETGTSGDSQSGTILSCFDNPFGTSGTSDTGLKFRINNNNRLEIRINNDSNAIIEGIRDVYTRTCHFVLTYDGTGSFELWQNKELQASINTNFKGIDSNWFIGKDETDDQSVLGTLYHLCFFNEKLSEKQIGENFEKGGLVPTGAEKHVTSYYPFTQKSGSVFFDMVYQFNNYKKNRSVSNEDVAENFENVTLSNQIGFFKNSVSYLEFDVAFAFLSFVDISFTNQDDFEKIIVELFVEDLNGNGFTVNYGSGQKTIDSSGFHSFSLEFGSGTSGIPFTSLRINQVLNSNPFTIQYVRIFDYERPLTFGRNIIVSLQNVELEGSSQDIIKSFYDDDFANLDVLSSDDSGFGVVIVEQPYQIDKTFDGQGSDFDGTTATIGNRFDSNVKTFSVSNDELNEIQNFIGTDPNIGFFYGDRLAINQNFLVITDYTDAETENLSGAIYVYEKNQTTGNYDLLEKRKASNPDAFARFGWSVDIFENEIVIGSYQDGSGFGRIYVYDYSSTNASEVQLTNSNRPPSFFSNDWQLGSSVAIYDGIIAGGAWQEDDTGPASSGAVYIYEKDENGSWNETQIIKAPTPIENERFGGSVSLNDRYLVIGTNNTFGGINKFYVYEKSLARYGDRYEFLVEIEQPAGASKFAEWIHINQFNEILASSSKVGYLFTQDGNNWQLDKYFQNGEDLDGQVSSVINKYLVKDTMFFLNQKKYYVSVDDTVIELVDFEDNNFAEFDLFDNTIRVERNETLAGEFTYVFDANDVINALIFDENEINSTKDFFGGIIDFEVKFNAFDGILFSLNSVSQDSFKTCQTPLVSLNNESGDLFGTVSISQDLIVVGAVGEDSNGTSGFNNTLSLSGAAYVFERGSEACQWQQIDFLKASNPDQEDRFGFAVDIYQGIIIVGADQEESNGSSESDNSLSFAGAAYIFERNGSFWDQTAYLKASSPASFDLFGSSVSIWGETAVVGAYGKTTNVFAEGLVYIYEKNQNGTNAPSWDLVQTLNSSLNQSFEQFGNNVSINNDQLIIGCLNTNGRAYIFEKNIQGTWDEVVRIDGSGGQFGFWNDIEENYAAIGAPDEAGGGAVYIYEKNVSGTNLSWNFYQKITASNRDTSDRFGCSVSINNSVIVVGASNEASDGSSQQDNSENAAGAAYVFKQNETGQWIQIEYLKSVFPTKNQSFGLHTGIDGNTIVIGEQFGDITGEFDNNGAAYVFSNLKAPFAISSQIILKASIPDVGDWFGGGVSISGDRAIVGARFEDSDGSGTNNAISNSGAAYIFERIGLGNWSEVEILKASNFSSNDQFGFSVDINEDRAIVGAPLAGAYVFERNGSGVWSEVAILQSSNFVASDNFGWSVSISGDYAIIGAPFEDSDGSSPSNNSAVSAGAAYVFERNGSGVWSEVAYLKASSVDSFDEFGRSVSISGDFAIVGANTEDSDGSSPSDNSLSGSGAAYVFERNGSGVWSEVAYLKASNVGAGDDFGWSVSISGTRAIVGARGEGSDGSGPNDNSANNAGAAYVFERNGSGVWSEVAYLKASSVDSLDEFGTSVSISGDLAIIGASSEDSNASGTNNLLSNSGAAYIFERNASGIWSEVEFIKALNVDAGDSFGSSVSISNGKAIVGSNLEDSDGNDPNSNSLSDSGAAYIFE